mmetsp:Transcript_10430/g.28495  ORF Transcript_10430/g.28495 Transcript_10430/m.28495 type:complete len:91 (-) Transcript_10430:1504-1776(-)
MAFHPHLILDHRLLYAVCVGNSGNASSPASAAARHWHHTPNKLAKAAAKKRPLNQAWKNWNSSWPPSAESMLGLYFSGTFLRMSSTEEMV